MSHYYPWRQGRLLEVQCGVEVNHPVPIPPPSLLICDGIDLKAERSLGVD
jgi:hypothetical protein